MTEPARLFLYGLAYAAVGWATGFYVARMWPGRPTASRPLRRFDHELNRKIFMALRKTEMTGRELMRCAGVRDEFYLYEVMCELEDYEFVAGWYEGDPGLDNLVRARRYRLTPAGLARVNGWIGEAGRDAGREIDELRQEIEALETKEFRP